MNNNIPFRGDPSPSRISSTTTSNTYHKVPETLGAHRSAREPLPSTDQDQDQIYEIDSVPLPADDQRIVVGVDFGTTYSGVAFVYSAAPDIIDVIKSWPGGNGITSDKVPSEIAYLSSKTSLQQKVQWGFQFKPEESRLRCIKLFLDRNQPLPYFVSAKEAAAQLRQYGRNIMDAVSDYLTQIYKHTMDTLARRYGKSFISMTNVEFVLTVPAVWSDAAKDATLKAAERAGMGDSHNLKLISEPEAAAVYTLKSMPYSHLRIGDNFVVCDAGGGTVDLISYKITGVSPMTLEETAVGTGGLCGSTFLNFRFENHVRARLGEKRYKYMREKQPKTWQMGLNYFEEYVKRNFNQDEHQEVHVPFPGLSDDEDAGLESGFLILTTAQVKAIFEPVVEEVCKLVEGQVEGIREKGESVQWIILVGGFGQSKYLYDYLKAHFNSAAPPPYTERPTHAPQHPDAVEVLQPMNAWTAVVRGAVLRGLEGSPVVSRRSRWHYGTSYATVYSEEKHSLSDRYWSPLWERWMVGDRMQWHIAKGTPISEHAPLSFHYTRNFRPGQSRVVSDKLIACADEVPPDVFRRSSRSVSRANSHASRGHQRQSGSVGGLSSYNHVGPSINRSHSSSSVYKPPSKSRQISHDPGIFRNTSVRSLDSVASAPVIPNNNRFNSADNNINRFGNANAGDSGIGESESPALSAATGTSNESGSGNSANTGKMINVCTLTTDLAAVPPTLFTRLTTSKGLEFDSLDFSLDMSIQSAGLVFQLKVDGVAYGTVTTEFY
ncbi:actin-like ATPase domain-containing protein [Xylona heveae TC161]|uniref:Actin-like ATPase domain-containing protein n=1 Tax=Xylona heveae (strain CBS 132557 / TC161) TaxID=1328760 RepID=A0A165A6E7_XYLHT|nr:actin-like ATPase domain-containing protein [Xylona heveae TC161]KZF20017.1 actin-like ATPase domain-containing protein [Xylona heveae TC161]